MAYRINHLGVLEPLAWRQCAVVRIEEYLTESGKVQDNGLEPNALPEPERATEQEHGCKAGGVRRRVRPRPATAARQG